MSDDISLVADSLESNDNSLLVFFKNLIEQCNLPGINFLLKNLGILNAHISSKNLIDFLRYLEIDINGNRQLLDQNIQAVEEIKARLKDEEMAALITRTLRKVLSGQRKNKVRLFATVLSNAVFKDLGMSILDKENCIDFCDELNENDLLVLKTLKGMYRGNIFEICKQLFTDTGKNDIKLNEVFVSFTKLESRGLIMLSEVKIKSIQKTIEADDNFKTLADIAKERHYEILPYGNNLCDLIESKFKDTSIEPNEISVKIGVP